MIKKAASLLLCLAAVAGLASCAAEPDAVGGAADLGPVKSTHSRPHASPTVKSPLTKDDIYVYTPQSHPGENGVNTSFICETPYGSVSFEGHALASTTPAVFLEDLTGDGFPDPAVILISGRGTGVWSEEIHVFDGRTLRKFEIENVGKTLNNYASKSSDDTSYTFELCGETYNIDKSTLVTEPSHLFPEVELGMDVSYYVLGGKIICSVSCRCGMNESCGRVDAVMKFNGYGFVLGSTSFIRRERI